ncbi:MAG: hypothetical protein HFJ80_06885 [Clostridiales bacterium]|nr:hypothetical protein [Clostridiales bacterium]
MKKTYRLENLDCANCAAKIERELKKLEGVEDAAVSFLTQRMTLEIDGAEEAVLEQVHKLIRRLEPDVRVR